MNSITQNPSLLQSVISNITNTDSEVQYVGKSITKTNKATILLVDDDTFLLGMYAKRLLNEGYDSVPFSSSEEALEFLRSGNTVDLMLIDIIMPGMSGLDFLQAIKDENLSKDAVKIVLSNMGDQTELIEKGEQLGVTKYMVKAESTPSDVLGLVNRMLS